MPPKQRGKVSKYLLYLLTRQSTDHGFGRVHDLHAVCASKANAAGFREGSAASVAALPCFISQGEEGVAPSRLL